MNRKPATAKIKTLRAALQSCQHDNAALHAYLTSGRVAEAKDLLLAQYAAIIATLKETK